MPMLPQLSTTTLIPLPELTEDQKQFLETSAACEKQMLKIIRDVDLEIIEDGSMELEKAEFYLGSVINAVVSQVMLLLRERNLQLIWDIPEEIKTLAVYGNQARIQQVLAEFLLNMVRYAPSAEGWVEIHVRPALKRISEGLTTVRTEFRMVCPGEGLPPELVQDMFHSSRWMTQEGLGLSMCRKIPVPVLPEAVAALFCSGHGRAYLDGLVDDGNGEPVCECNSCYSGSDCSHFIPDCIANANDLSALPVAPCCLEATFNPICLPLGTCFDLPK
ncbi:hypothetical protein COLO4_22929 [Corchorus olitorius]|uniref:Histidine kinase domain-containing protein n=1 Tax=Corchorus olitorius TaxID=93759 RepID=A0A1R3IJ10_9ROSI|nr:hypothetical protein COLO4_22929 [Corchorus olitorius]